MYTVKEVFINKIISDLRVQRPLDPIRLDKMEKTFNLGSVGVVCLSYRSDTDQYVVLDGQHRVAVMGRKGIDKVTAEVYEGLTLEQEAKIFLNRNNAVPVPYLDKFWVRVTSGDVIAIAVMEMINNFGWRIPRQEPQEGTKLNEASPQFNSVHNFESIYKRDSDRAQTVLNVVANAYGIAGTDFRILRGVEEFLKFADRSKNFDPSKLAEKLRSIPPQTLLHKGQTYAEAMRMSIGSAIAALITSEYNKYLKSQYRIGHE